MDDISEVRELVSAALEHNGVLARMRAQLRASVLTALNEADRKSGVYNENPALLHATSSDEGLLALKLVRELLSAYDLKATASVFDAEVAHLLPDAQAACSRPRVAAALADMQKFAVPLDRGQVPVLANLLGALGQARSSQSPRSPLAQARPKPHVDENISPLTDDALPARYRQTRADGPPIMGARPPSAATASRWLPEPGAAPADDAMRLRPDSDFYAAADDDDDADDADDADFLAALPPLPLVVVDAAGVAGFAADAADECCLRFLPVVLA